MSPGNLPSTPPACYIPLVIVTAILPLLVNCHTVAPRHDRWLLVIGRWSVRGFKLRSRDNQQSMSSAQWDVFPSRQFSDGGSIIDRRVAEKSVLLSKTIKNVDEGKPRKCSVSAHPHPPIYKL